MTSTRRGAVFIMTLAVLAGLISIVAAVAAEQNQALIGQSHRMEAKMAREATESGIQAALVELSTQATAQTLQTDDWYNYGQLGAVRYIVGNCSYRIQIIDDSSRLNMNLATSAQLNQLPLTAEQIDSLLDWREAGETARSDGGKDQYYNSLDNSYNAKLGNLDSIDELVLVKGWTANTLYATSTNNTSSVATLTDANGNQIPLADVITVDSVSTAGTGLTNLANITNAANLRGIAPTIATDIVAQRTSLTTMGAVLQLPGMDSNSATNLLNGYTVGAATNQRGRIDLNTATQSVLSTLPGVTSDVAAAIVTRQISGFNGLGDLMSIPGVTVSSAAQFVDLVAVNGQVFVARIIGKAGSTQIALEVTIQLNGTTPKIIRIATPEYPNPMTHWGWQTDTTSDVTQVGTQ